MYFNLNLMLHGRLFFFLNITSLEIDFFLISSFDIRLLDLEIYRFFFYFSFNRLCWSHILDHILIKLTHINSNYYCLNIFFLYYKKFNLTHSIAWSINLVLKLITRKEYSKFIIHNSILTPISLNIIIKKKTTSLSFSQSMQFSCISIKLWINRNVVTWIR
jgi:hypothetical protein